MKHTWMDNCVVCHCKAYTIVDTCPCRCHEALERLSKKYNGDLERAKQDSMQLRNQINEDPLTRAQYEARMIKRMLEHMKLESLK